MVELVKYIAQSLVEKPEAVDVREVETEDSIVIELRVDPEDMGKVIGKQGRIAKAIRTASLFTRGSPPNHLILIAPNRHPPVVESSGGFLLVKDVL